MGALGSPCCLPTIQGDSESTRNTTASHSPGCFSWRRKGTQWDGEHCCGLGLKYLHSCSCDIPHTSSEERFLREWLSMTPIQNSQRPLLLHKKPRVNILLPSIQLHPDLWLHRSWTATPSPDWTSSVVTEPESHPRHSPTGSYLVFLVSFHQLDRKSDWGRSTIDWGIAAIEVAHGLPGSIFLIVTQCRTQSTVGGIISALVDLDCKLKITEQANLSASSLPGFCFSSYLCVPAWVPALNDEHARMDM